MKWDRGVRQTHRWLAIAFTVAVIVNIIAVGEEKCTVCLGFLALLPLVALMLTASPSREMSAAGSKSSW
ncbi:MAG: hypothetical protein EHM23_23335 [Acidobacteria bacterium]|nr:MAG: hypothetical protein EHM23_23335 [Acidobacteriota bacterium]